MNGRTLKRSLKRLRDGKTDPARWVETYKALRSTKDDDVLPMKTREALVDVMVENPKVRHVLLRLFVCADDLGAHVPAGNTRNHLLQVYYEYGKRHLHDNFAGETFDRNPTWYPALHGAWRDHMKIVRERTPVQERFTLESERVILAWYNAQGLERDTYAKVAQADTTYDDLLHYGAHLATRGEGYPTPNQIPQTETNRIIQEIIRWDDAFPLSEAKLLADIHLNQIAARYRSKEAVDALQPQIEGGQE